MTTVMSWWMSHLSWMPLSQYRKANSSLGHSWKLKRRVTRLDFFFFLNLDRTGTASLLKRKHLSDKVLLFLRSNSPLPETVLRQYSHNTTLEPFLSRCFCFHTVHRPFIYFFLDTQGPSLGNHQVCQAFCLGNILPFMLLLLCIDFIGQALQF